MVAVNEVGALGILRELSFLGHGHDTHASIQAGRMATCAELAALGVAPLEHDEGSQQILSQLPKAIALWLSHLESN